MQQARSRPLERIFVDFLHTRGSLIATPRSRMATKTISLFDLAPGKTLLDRYHINRVNRHGGMSTTFEVDDKSGGGTAEMQVFPAALFESHRQSLEFSQAMQVWKVVSSPAVLKVRDIHSTEDGTILFVTDLPLGESLRNWQKEHKTVEPHEAVGIGLHLLDGLVAIHAAGLVHGDIKPHTVHIEEKKKRRVTLIDGGITPSLWTAKHLGDKTALIGTPFYAPVEQFGGESPDVQSDVYNLATVLFELVCGVIPWKGKSFLEVFQAKLSKSPPSMKACAPKISVPADLEAAIVKGLMADKKARYANADEFRKALKAVKK
jgi:serine/threonine-protein kinase